jgi:drug/metabolite transporter (DMT)-like permease
MFHAAEFVSPGLATVIANGQPLLAAILADAVLGEKIKAMGKVGLACDGLPSSALHGWPPLLEK